MEKQISSLDTEQRNPNTMNLDQLSTIEILKKINDEDHKVAKAIELELENIEKLVDATYEAFKNGGRIIYIGAGTSGRLGVLDSAECPPTYGTNPDDIVALIAGGNEAIFKAVEGAEDSEELAVNDLKALNLNAKDIVIGLAASGRTPYVIGGLNYANELGAKTGSIACAKDTKIGEIANYPVEVIVGPEAVTGSTRMKAGTAQKLVLNMLSTSVMVKMGKVYENLMVDVKTSNEKLINRATRIVAQAINTDLDKAKELLEDSNMDVKVAIIKGLVGCSNEECLKLLEKNENNVSKTIRENK